MLRSALPLLPLALAGALLLSACSDENAVPSASTLSQETIGLGQDTTVDASLAQFLRQDERFRVFSTLLDSAGLMPALQRGGPYTVFAATDSGIEQMPDGLVDELLRTTNRERLRQIMAYHLHDGQLATDSLRGLDSVSTFAGQALPVVVEAGRVLIGGERTSEHTVTASNGRLFAFDALVTPPIGGSTAQLPAPSTYDTTQAADTVAADTLGS